jgi:membrane protease YdiL (CAAX protease family)
MSSPRPQEPDAEPEPPRDPPQGPTYVGARDWPPSEMRWPPPGSAQTPADGRAPGAALDPEHGPAAAERPAPFTALVLLGLIWMLVQIGSLLVVRAWSTLSSHADELRTLSGDAYLARLLELPGGLEVMLLSVQIPLLLFAFLLAAALPGGMSAGLGLVRPRIGIGGWISALGGTLVLQLIAGGVVKTYFDVPEHLKALDMGLRERPVWIVVACAVLLPALCEELFFRGWLQRRLRVAWGPFAAVLLSAFTFAAYHGNLVHAAALLPMALWIAWWAERTRSTWIGVACHAANNGAVCAVLFLGLE